MNLHVNRIDSSTKNVQILYKYSNGYYIYSITYIMPFFKILRK